jgi:hypothetical protein
VDHQTNEIPPARTLIGRLDRQGKIVQLDGLHTQQETVHQILYEKGGDYHLILRAISLSGLSGRKTPFREPWFSPVFLLRIICL